MALRHFVNSVAANLVLMGTWQLAAVFAVAAAATLGWIGVASAFPPGPCDPF